MRHFLATYSFTIDISINELLRCLRNLQTNYYVDPKENKFIKIYKLKYERNNIFGYAEYGTHGNKLPVYDTNNGKQTKTIEINESPVYRYFYRFFLASESKGILILERIGNIGIRKAFIKAINSSCERNIINVNPLIFGVSQILRDGKLKKLILKVRFFPREIDEKLKASGIEDSTSLEREIVISAKRNRFIDGFLDRLREQFQNLNMAEIGEILKENFGEETEQIKLIVNINNKQRTLVFENGFKFRSWLEIENYSFNDEEALKLKLDKSDEIINLILNEKLLLAN